MRNVWSANVTYNPDTREFTLTLDNDGLPFTSRLFKDISDYLILKFTMWKNEVKYDA